MPTTEIITIINNSGKVISTGKHLVNIFKEAKAAYQDKREAIKAERRGIQRAKTFDVAPRGRPGDLYDDEYYYEEEIDHVYDRRAIHDVDGRRRSQEDGRSHASSRHSRRSRRSHRPRSSDRDNDHDRDRERRPALTIDNLRTHSEVSATAPSTAPKTYRSPYAETAPRDMQLSRPTLAHAATMPVYPTNPQHAPISTGDITAVSTPRQSMLVHRPRSDASLTKKKEIDMHLAYGNIPPDLAHRTDLDPVEEKAVGDSLDPQETEALNLMDRIEGLLDEAHCVQHSASAMISTLQQNPEAAAAVALTLAELSAILGKMSPAFLGMLKGGSPAIFALLASPQFLIATGIAVGVTIVMFGGWKIVKRIRDANNKEKEPAFEMQSGAIPQAMPSPQDMPRQPSASSASFEEALVLEEELSTIESWRRGISAVGEDETADIELMSAEADRALRERYRDDDEVDPDDSVSRIGARSIRSHRTSKSHRTHRSSRRPRSEHKDDDDVDVPERKSSKKYPSSKRNGAAVSEVAASERSHRSHRSSGGSHHGSSASRSSKHTAKIGLKAIEDGSRVDDETSSLDSVLGKPPKEKKNNMLKQLFKKKKDKEDKATAVSVLV